MTLLNDFFFLVQKELLPDSVKAKITIDPRHEIFEGHFPGRPLVPGVCMMQIILEIMQTVIGKSMRLTKADTVKFLAVMTPKENEKIDVMINYFWEPDRLSITANLFSGRVIFFKLKGTLTIG